MYYSEHYCRPKNRSNPHKLIEMPAALVSQLDDAQLKWNEANKIFSEIYNQNKSKKQNAAEQIAKQSKQIVHASMHDTYYNSVSKVDLISRVYDSIGTAMCIGNPALSAAASLLSDSFIRRIIIQTSKDNHDDMTQAQLQTYEHIKNNPRIINLNEQQCSGNFMNVGCTHNIMYKLMSEYSCGQPAVIIYDDGVPYDKYVSGDYDGWEVLYNIISTDAPSAMSIIKVNIQNGIFMTDTTDEKQKISYRMKLAMSYAEERGLTIKFMKSPLSWNGNNTITVILYNCQFTQGNPIVSDFNPYYAVIEKINVMTATLNSMILYINH